MNKLTRISIAFIGLMAVGSAQADAAWIWTPQTRRWINPKNAAKDTPAEQMQVSLNYFEAGDYAKSSKEFTKLVKTYPRSELAPDAQYLAGVSYELQNSLADAFSAYKQVVEIYPFSGRFKDSIEREFAVAEALFSGEKMRLLGPVKVVGMDKAIEIYEHIVQHAPYGEYGDKAQFRLGDSYIRQKRYEEANRAFQKMTEEYSDSPLVEQAKFKVAFCARQLSLKASYDQSATDEAITWYEKFIATKPSPELFEQAKESLKQLHTIKAEGLMKIAEFYEIQKKWDAAAVYCKQVIRDYSDTDTAAQAAAKLGVIEAKGGRKS